MFEASAARAGRLFVPVALECGREEAVERRGRGSVSFVEGRDGVDSGVGMQGVRMGVGYDEGGSGRGRSELRLAGLGVGKSWDGGCGLAAPVHAGLTVDVTCASAFEAALQIVEFVRGLEVERDTELCSSGSAAGGGNVVTASGESVGRERVAGYARLSGM